MYGSFFMISFLECPWTSITDYYVYKIPFKRRALSMYSKQQWKTKYYVNLTWHIVAGYFSSAGYRV